MPCPVPRLLLTALLLSGGGALAQTPAPLTRAAVVAGARARSPELQAARARLTGAQERATGAGRLLPENPELELEGASDAPFGNEGERSYGAFLSQTLEVAGQGGLRRTEARARLAEARARLAALEAQVAERASEAHRALWAAQERRTLAAQALELARALDVAAERRYGAGDIPELERNTVALELARAEGAAAEAEREWLEAQLALSRLLALPAGAQPVAAALDRPAPAQLPPLPQLQARAREARPDLLVARSAEEAARAEARRAARERVPNPTLRVGIERERDTLGLDGPTDARLMDTSTKLQLGLSLPLPLWDRNTAEVGTARAEARGAALEREALERGVEAEVAASHAVLERSHRALSAFEAALPRMERNLELVRRGFEAGQVQLLELLAMRDRTQQARAEYVEAQAAYGRALDSLQRATGQLTLEAK